MTTDELIEDIKSGTADTASVVQQYSSSLLSRNQARCNVVNEILTAERDYVKHLRDIVQVCGHFNLKFYPGAESSLVCGPYDMSSCRLGWLQ